MGRESGNRAGQSHFKIVPEVWQGSHAFSEHPDFFESALQKLLDWRESPCALRLHPPYRRISRLLPHVMVFLPADLLGLAEVEAHQNIHIVPFVADAAANRVLEEEQPGKVRRPKSRGTNRCRSTMKTFHDQSGSSLGGKQVSPLRM